MAKRIVMTMVGALLLSAQASAQTAGDVDKLAKEEYQAGIAQYNLTNYDRAVEHFKTAYELTRKPALLFNIAQAYRLKRDCASAKTFYTNYHREQSAVDPNDPNIDQAADFIQEMEKCLGASSAPTTVPPPKTEPVRPVVQPPTAVPTPTPAPPVEADEPDRPGSSMKTAGLIVGAIGLATSVTGLYFAVKSGDWENMAEDEWLLCRDDTPPCTQQEVRDRFDDKGQTANLLGYTLGFGGVAIAAAGAYLYYLGMTKESDTSVSLSPAPGGGAVFFSGTF